jgi:hypothetical protein
MTRAWPKETISGEVESTSRDPPKGQITICLSFNWFVYCSNDIKAEWPVALCYLSSSALQP